MPELASPSVRDVHDLTGAGAAPLGRAMAFLGIGGAFLGLIGVLLPHPEQFNVTGLVVMQAVTVSFALPMLLIRRIPTWVLRTMPSVGTLINTVVIAFSGDATSAYALFYLWVGFFAFYFLSPRDAALHVAFAAANYAFVLIAVGSPPPQAGGSTEGDLVHHFVIAAGTLLIAGTLLLYLRSKVGELVAKLVDAAHTDLLTGLPNRSGLHDLLEREVERAGMGGGHVCLLVTDLDSFKEINDRYGHDAGDRVLRAVASMLDGATRRIDIVGRTGGAEFAIVVPEMKPHKAYLLAEQLLARVRRGFEQEDVNLTTSFGIATYPDHAVTADGLFKVADEALFAAKALGRDRAVVYSPEVSAVLSGTASRRSSDEQGHLVTVLSLAEALDLRDGGTARHSETVGAYAELMARELGLPAETVERVRLAGILHDIGKIGIPDAILKKPGRLDDDEWALMKQHTEIGARILGSSELADIREWVLDSHERPDGKGYPRGLVLEELPLEARILSVADSYEAMIADRVYSPAIPEEEARAELRRCSGTQFDPQVVDAFMRALDRQQLTIPG